MLKALSGEPALLLVAAFIAVTGATMLWLWLDGDGRDWIRTWWERFD